MTVTSRTRVGIIGAGPAGLMLSQLLALRGIESVVVESRPRGYCEARQRAGMLEAGTVAALRAAGAGQRLDAEGLEHDGIYLQFGGTRQHVSFRELVGRTVTVYAQTEIVKDLIAARLAAGQAIEFAASSVSVAGIESAAPVLSYIDARGVSHAVTCEVIAGCDGFHGISRPLVPGLSVYERSYPYAWLGILADAAPSTDELIYARHPSGFALYSMRSAAVSRLYLQVPAGESLDRWPDERIWAELQARFELPGWSVSQGPVTDRSITPMRSFVAGPMRHGRLFLAGDAAHIVPPCGAKGLNLAVGDAVMLAAALSDLLLSRSPALADAYSDACMARAWRATRFSHFMTAMTHVQPDDPFDDQIQLAQLRYVTSSAAAATSLAENYSGYESPVVAL
jgi:p-hydroxybenzoate 3-monooxygenase